MMKRTHTRLPATQNKQSGEGKINFSDVREPRVKGKSSQTLYEKYINLAHESMTTGDRILAESHYQHAEHYLRLINEFKANAPVTHTCDSVSFAGEESSEGSNFEISIEEELEMSHYNFLKDTEMSAIN